jgi:6-pyruvoyltetrahydropterin/6-carboxytetrahydropterin synthase
MNHSKYSYELSQRFYFEAAHTLHRSYDAVASNRIHGHTYEAEITINGTPDANTGMIVDIAQFRMEIERIRQLLDHQFLDDVVDLGPATLESLSYFIFNKMQLALPNIVSVMVERKVSGDRCVFRRVAQVELSGDVF